MTSNINMDYKKYFRYQNNVYHLHFLNRTALNKDEIKQRFSLYGNVVAVTETSYKTGMRFVTFRTEEEVINCLRGLQGSDIELLPERKFTQETNPQNGRNKRGKNSLGQVNTKPPHVKTHKSCKKEINKCTTHEHNKSFLETSTEYSCNIEDDCDFLDVTSALKFSSYENNIEENNSMQSSEKFVQDSTNDSLNEIEWKKFTKIDKDGCYCVHFYEHNNLSRKEIEDIFSSYGNVISIQFGMKNNSDSKFRLVRYQTAAEVISCIKGLQNNKQIKLLPEKHKVINLAAVKIGQSENIVNQEQAAEPTRTRNSNSNRAEEQQKEDTSYSATKGDACYKVPPLLSYYKIPPLVSDNKVSESEVEHENADMERSLQAQLTAKSSTTYKKDIPLQEIIVANIHENYGAPYILHLLEQKKYKPVTITVVNATRDNKVRYCKVYLKTIKEAISIEKEMDNFCLSGKNLIVLRQSCLKEE